MADETTSYRVDVQYDVTDKASRTLDQIARHAEHTAGIAAGLKSTLMGVGSAILGGGALMAAKHWFVDFNAEVQNAKIGLSAMLEGNLGGTWDQATAHADKLYLEFQKFSTLTPVTTQQMMDFGRGTAMAVFAAHGSIKDFTNVTEQGVVAAKALGAEGFMASRQLAMMLGGNIGSRNRFGMQLLSFMGPDMNATKFKALSAHKRLMEVEKALNSDPMKHATDAFSTSFSGVTSTLEDKLQILLGKIGLPLFKAITAEVGSWNKWLTDNQEEVDKFAKTVGGKLVDGFHMIKDVFAFIYEHRSTFFEIARLWAINRAVGGIGGMLGGMAGAGGGKVASAQRTAAGAAIAFDIGWQIGSQVDRDSEFGHAVGTVVQKFGQLGHAIGLWSADFSDESRAMVDKERAIQAAMSRLDDSIDAAHKRVTKWGGMFSTVQAGQLIGLADEVKADQKWFAAQRARIAANGGPGMVFENNESKWSIGDMAIDKMGAAMEQAFSRREMLQNEAYANPIAANSIFLGAMSQLNKTSIAQLDVQKGMEDVMIMTQKLIGSGMMAVPGMAKLLEAKAIVALAGDVDSYGAKGKKGGDTNVHIDRVEVAAKDPARWIADLDAEVHKRIRAPRQPKRAMRGGL